MQSDNKWVPEEGQGVLFRQGALDLVALGEVGFEEDFKGVDRGLL